VVHVGLKAAVVARELLQVAFGGACPLARQPTSETLMLDAVALDHYTRHHVAIAGGHARRSS